jgi:hypothetical protein
MASFQHDQCRGWALQAHNENDRRCEESEIEQAVFHAPSHDLPWFGGNDGVALLNERTYAYINVATNQWMMDAR